MNKKNILSEIENLANRNNQLFDENNELKLKLDELQNKFSALDSELTDAKNVIAEKNEYIKRMEEKSVSDRDCLQRESVEEASQSEGASAVLIVDTDLEYINKGTKAIDKDYGTGIELASAAIGNVVMKCSELCSVFADKGGNNAKDLINLALGRTEVFKSEALAIIEDFEDISVITGELQKKMNSTLEYFDLLERQI